MKVFISWSGERSRLVAEALRIWLPNVIQTVDAWMSANDIEKGSRWQSGLNKELEQSGVGIICLTRDNLDSNWIHFEAGALAKEKDKTHVCTFLVGVDPKDVREPLRQFQHTTATRNDVRRLLSTINNKLTDFKRSESQLDKSFDKWWQELEPSLSLSPEPIDRPIHDDREILDEILEIVRSLRRVGGDSPPPQKFRSPFDTATDLDVVERALLFKVWDTARVLLAKMKSGVDVPALKDSQVRQVEEFVTTLQGHRDFGREVARNLIRDPHFYDYLFRASDNE